MDNIKIDKRARKWNWVRKLQDKSNNGVVLERIARGHLPLTKQDARSFFLCGEVTLCDNICMV